MKTIRVIDSHTGGEPTRVIIEGGPQLGSLPMDKIRALLESEHDWLRRALVTEPRGSEIMVGALLCPPFDPSSDAGVVYFDNAKFIGMCGHGTIGLISTLAYLGRTTPGTQRLETPVGVVTTTLHEDGQVSLENVPCYRYRHDVEIEVPQVGKFLGDIAWGGNWFFVVHETDERIELSNARRLTKVTRLIRETLQEKRLIGDDGEEVDHIILQGPGTAQADACNFVLCPGAAYDRSPCGTGTSAIVACLAADGRLSEGQVWRQQSVVGSVFAASYRSTDRQRIVPTITGRAHILADAQLIFDPDDPFVHGIR